MCLTKTHKKPLVANEDLYLVKKSNFRAMPEYFESCFQHFFYRCGIVYKKGWWSRFRAKFRKSLDSEVFHVFDPTQSKWRVNYDKYARSCYGIFCIPKGTEYHIGNDGDIGAFAIEYIGPLTEETRNLILNQ